LELANRDLHLLHPVLQLGSLVEVLPGRTYLLQSCASSLKSPFGIKGGAVSIIRSGGAFLGLLGEAGDASLGIEQLGCSLVRNMVVSLQAGRQVLEAARRSAEFDEALFDSGSLIGHLLAAGSLELRQRYVRVGSDLR
jgi:hypothetical protein